MRTLFSKVSDHDGNILGRYVGFHKKSLIVQKKSGECFLVRNNNVQPEDVEYYYNPSNGEFRAIKNLCENSQRIKWDFVVQDNQYGDLCFIDCKEFLLVTAYGKSSGRGIDHLGGIKLNNMNDVMNLIERFTDSV